MDTDVTDTAVSSNDLLTTPDDQTRMKYLLSLYNTSCDLDICCTDFKKPGYYRRINVFIFWTLLTYEAMCMRAHNSTINRVVLATSMVIDLHMISAKIDWTAWFADVQAALPQPVDDSADQLWMVNALEYLGGVVKQEQEHSTQPKKAMQKLYRNTDMPLNNVHFQYAIAMAVDALFHNSIDVVVFPIIIDSTHADSAKHALSVVLKRDPGKPSRGLFAFLVDPTSLMCRTSLKFNAKHTRMSLLIALLQMSNIINHYMDENITVAWDFTHACRWKQMYPSCCLSSNLIAAVLAYDLPFELPTDKTKRAMSDAHISLIMDHISSVGKECIIPSVNQASPVTKYKHPTYTQHYVSDRLPDMCSDTVSRINKCAQEAYTKHGNSIYRMLSNMYVQKSTTPPPAKRPRN